MSQIRKKLLDSLWKPVDRDSSYNSAISNNFPNMDYDVVIVLKMSDFVINLRSYNRRSKLGGE